MSLKRQIVVYPSTESSCEIRTFTERGYVVLPRLGVRAFDHSIEIVVVDLAGQPAHTIVIRQSGDIEVDA
jgi:hypothetical protein